MAGRETRVRGTRVTLTIPPDLVRQLAGSPGVARAMAQRVKAIAALADTTCPVGESGKLKQSQETDVLITPGGVVGAIGYTEFYAHMVHNGTAHSTPDPWLLNAALSVLVSQQQPHTAVA